MATFPTPPDGSVTTAKLVDGAVTAAKVAADVATQAELNAEAAAREAADTALAASVGSGDAVDIDFTPTGTLVSTNVQAAIAELLDETQPVDSDLTAIAALTTTTYGRAFLALADAAAGRTALGLGTAATTAASAYEVAGAAAAAQAAAIAASQPLDSDLTSIAALTTTSYGRAFLALADAAAARTAVGLGNVDNTSDANKPVSTAQATADALAVPKALADAKGDLLVATANDTVARLAVGTNTHVLTADSAEATGVKWAAASGGSGIPASTVDAKGDLLVGTADDTVARQAVGSGGHVLAADSGQTSGVRWIGLPFVAPASGDYLTSQFYSGNASGSTTQGLMRPSPVWIGAPLTLASLAVVVNTGVASAVIRLGIYDSLASGKPGALILDAGTVDASSSGVKTVATSQLVAPGLKWLVGVVQVAGCTPRAFSAVMGSMALSAGGSNLVIQTPGQNVYNVTGVTGALPSSPTWNFETNVSISGAINVIGMVAA